MRPSRRMLLIPSLLLLLAAALCLAPRRVEVRTELLHWQTDDPAVSAQLVSTRKKEVDQ